MLIRNDLLIEHQHLFYFFFSTLFDFRTFGTQSFISFTLQYYLIFHKIHLVLLYYTSLRPFVEYKQRKFFFSLLTEQRILYFHRFLAQNNKNPLSHSVYENWLVFPFVHAILYCFRLIFVLLLRNVPRLQNADYFKQHTHIKYIFLCVCCVNVVVANAIIVPK